MQSFIVGQRVISDAEMQMGLGTVLKTDQRTVTVVFLATGDTRTYALQSAPLTRVAFSRGDLIKNHEGVEIRVTDATEEAGLIRYQGVDTANQEWQVHESELDNFLRLNKPADRLFNGQIDKDNWFRLRQMTLQQRNRLAHSDIYGLAGGRTSLIPHQLYIAHEVARRFAPRVLLADEVGLGKTIEAGMILHQQLLTGLASRVLIVVPESLVHQWLVEMLRRFNLHFRIFDNSRCDELVKQNEYENIFMSEQLVLCSINFLVDKPEYRQQCESAGWDLMVVDEAHHLEWSSDSPSEEYCLVENLARRVSGVLLLTATPEQLGKESHFARLRLLDDDRFPDYASFIQEESHYQPYANLIEDLLEGKALDANDIELLESTINEGDNQLLVEQLSSSDVQQQQSARQQLIDHLLDRHGTGRVLFRNTRHAVSGFPARQLNTYALPTPDAYQHGNNSGSDSQAVNGIYPERQLQQSNETWTRIDPRISWLSAVCVEHQPDKILVICASALTALDIVAHFRINTRLEAAAFHEGLSIVERDRASAYFADKETGCQILVCSEIGSEGRNFQFAHHLVLFDLPTNPDLLEQRIGRLDRIGQQNTIQIHLPYLQHGPQEIMYRWYHEGLDAFEHTCPVGHAVYNKFHNELSGLLQAGADDASSNLEALISNTRDYRLEMNQALQKGRDRLLEYNSCRPVIANSIAERCQQALLQHPVQDYMELAFDCFGIDHDVHSKDCYVIHPTEQMTTRFPGLSDDGTTITYDRDVALSYEDTEFLSWEHPMVINAMDMVTSSELGNTSLITVSDLPPSSALKAGSMLMECLYSIEVPSVGRIQSERFLPPTMIRVVCDEKGRDISSILDHDAINENSGAVELAVANKVIRARSKLLKAMQQRCEAYASKKTGPLLKQAHEASNTLLDTEINRLLALSAVNPNIRKSEIEYFQTIRKELENLLEHANLRFDAMRVIVVT